jgi:hypothetical protein
MVSDDVGFQYTFAFWATSLSILSVIFLVHAYLIRKYIPKPKIKEGFKFSSPVFSAMYDTIVALWNLCFGDGDMTFARSSSAQGSTPVVRHGFSLGKKTSSESSIEVEFSSMVASKSKMKPKESILTEELN